MEGPTPVSALIHAATMVTAGVYLVIRANELYDLVPHIGYFIACLGAFVAIFAASMACVNNDLKRIIAYSTLSQLGYMFVAVGLGAYWVALFHLATHAFFKSLLFLGAGNVMHAMKDELDIRKMGGLHKKMKLTSMLMILASLALAGIFPLSGFFSKDKILEASFNGQFYVLYFVLFLSAILTAFYSFRLIMKVFFMEARYEQKEIHPHEAKFFVIASMIPLATLAVVAGWFEHEFIVFVTKALPFWEASNISSGTIYTLIALVSSASISSIYFAISKYKKGGFSKEYESTVLYKLLINQYYLPQIYHKLISKPYYLFSKWVFDVIETKIIDNLIDNIAKGIYFLGSKAQIIQNGNLSNMLRIMSFALLILLIIIMLLAVL